MKLWTAFIYRAVLFVLLSSIAHAQSSSSSSNNGGLRIGVGYGYGSGSANSGTLAFFNTAVGIGDSDNTQLTSADKGLQTFIAYEWTSIGIRLTYSTPNRGSSSGTFTQNGVTFGTSSTTMVTTEYGGDLYLKTNAGKSTVLYFGGGGGFYSSNLQETWNFNNKVPGFTNGTLNATSTNGGSRAFIGGNTKFGGGFGLTYEVVYTYLKQKNFIVNSGYNYFQGDPAFTPGNGAYGANGNGTGFNTTAFSADLSNVAARLYVTLSM